MVLVRGSVALLIGWIDTPAKSTMKKGANKNCFIAHTFHLCQGRGEVSANRASVFLDKDSVSKSKVRVSKVEGHNVDDVVKGEGEIIMRSVASIPSDIILSILLADFGDVDDGFPVSILRGLEALVQLLSAEQLYLRDVVGGSKQEIVRPPCRSSRRGISHFFNNFGLDCTGMMSGR
eukprot:g47087.t1